MGLEPGTPGSVVQRFNHLATKQPLRVRVSSQACAISVYFLYCGLQVSCQQSTVVIQHWPIRTITNDIISILIGHLQIFKFCSLTNACQTVVLQAGQGYGNKAWAHCKLPSVENEAAHGLMVFGYKWPNSPVWSFWWWPSIKTLMSSSVHSWRSALYRRSLVSICIFPGGGISSHSRGIIRCSTSSLATSSPTFSESTWLPSFILQYSNEPQDLLEAVSFENHHQN